FLILGSFPSAQSLERREYYGNPRNHFWRIAAACLGRGEPHDYGDKLALLRDGRIALWDVYAACERRGSLDKDIAAGAANPIVEFVAAHPGIIALGLNGGTAASALVAILPAASSLPRLAHTGDSLLWTPPFAQERNLLVTRLPSTSPVPTSEFRVAEDKLPLWKRFFTIQM
ncbi:DNA-deoxyinosine glycosylase, partial [bacterium]|nr:DNA-deoxyinosine glycosylase [bacterium]